MNANVITLALFVLAEGGEHAAAPTFWTNPAIWRPLNLLIFIIILVYLLRNKIRIGDVFDKRAAGIRKELEDARNAKEQAERKLAEVEARLNKLDQEVAAIKAESEQEGSREFERIVKGAAADAEKISQTAHREIDGAVKAAKSELRAFVAEQSVALAESMIRAEIRPDDSDRLLNKYIDEVGEVKR